MAILKIVQDRRFPFGSPLRTFAMTFSALPAFDSVPLWHVSTDQARLSMIGSRAFLLDAVGPLDLPLQRRIWALAQTVRQHPDVAELVPGMTNLLVVLRRTPKDVDGVIDFLQASWAAAGELQQPGRLIEVPTCYGGEHADDLPGICDYTGLSDREVVRRHQQGLYTVLALGSAPGFAYLAGLDPSIQVPRKKIPSLRMLRGTVTIGGPQTGIAALTGPNGWHALGFAELKVFDPVASPPTLLAPGDQVRFVPERIEL